MSEVLLGRDPHAFKGKKETSADPQKRNIHTPPLGISRCSLTCSAGVSPEAPEEVEFPEARLRAVAATGAAASRSPLVVLDTGWLMKD